MIVVDTNVIAYLLIEGDNTARAQTLWYQNPQWRLPILWRYEFSNVLATYTRSAGMTLADAKQLWQTASLQCGPMENEVDMATVLQFALEQEISAYDAQFVVLAHTLGVPLVSEDKRLRKRCKEIVVSLDEYIDV